ncbi:MAG TPA: AIR synthase related protein [Tepidisphaeraceae bacterium]|nr:AIR synthase related protein [Tepidisphaeraceae bacterium]
MGGLSYENSGVNYDVLDAFKRACQKAAQSTTGPLQQHGLREPPAVRGESAYLLEAADHFIAHVEEGLGTKNLVADAMLDLTGRSFYRNIGIDTVATIVNDLITCGALPISVAMHAAVGDAAWFSKGTRAQDLAEGFADGCRQGNAVWGGGETPALKGIVNPQTIVLAGSAIGRVQPKNNRIVGDVRDGDAIVALASSGVHTNGLTLCRALAERLPQGYLTTMTDGRTYGEALLDPSVIYVRFIHACQQAGLRLHYAAHVTGHGWRKLMRLEEPFVYFIHTLPQLPEVFRFLIEKGSIDLREAYATFNMGIGFAVFIRSEDVAKCVGIAGKNGYQPTIMGMVRKEGMRKALEIDPLKLVFEGETLNVR